MLHKIFFFFFLFLAFLLSSFSQTQDAGLWSSLTIEKEFTKKISVSLSEEFRFNENITELGSFFTDAGIAFKLNGDIKVSGCYRLISKKPLENYYSIRHRIYVDLALRKKIKKLTPGLRIRIQEQQADIYSSDEGIIPEWYLRPKVALRYNMKGKWASYLSSEWFYHVSKKMLDNFRFTVGVERKITGNLDLDLFFLHQQEVNVKNPTYDYIWGIGLNYSL